MSYPDPYIGPKQPRSENTRLALVLAFVLCVVVVVTIGFVALVVTGSGEDKSAAAARTPTQVSTVTVPAQTTIITQQMQPTSPQANIPITTNRAEAPSTGHPRGSSAGLFSNQSNTPGNCSQAGYCVVKSPTGNFYCYMRKENIRCYSPLDEALVTGLTLTNGDGRAIAPNAVMVNSDSVVQIGKSEIPEALLTRREVEQQWTLHYGEQVSAYNFTCAASKTKGVSCRYNPSGSGFSVRRGGYFFF